jgi:hypothetical protein
MERAIMGRFASQAAAILKRRVESGDSIAEAKRHAQTRFLRAVAERESAIADVLHRFAGDPPPEYRTQLSNEEQFITLEKEMMRELEDIKEDQLA